MDLEDYDDTESDIKSTIVVAIGNREDERVE
jgi:hypothetical protein